MIWALDLRFETDNARTAQALRTLIEDILEDHVRQTVVVTGPYQVAPMVTFEDELDA